MDKIVKSTISKIKQEKIKPEPRWKFLVKKYSVWLAFAVGLFLGAVSLAMALDWTSQLDWNIYNFSKPSLFFSIFRFIPYLWIILVIGFIALAFFDLRKTESGYKFSYRKMILILFGGLILISAVFFSFGLGKRFHGMVSEKVPFYGDHMMMTKQNQWMRPQEGFLAGKIVSKNKNDWEIRDFRGEKWMIIVDEKTKVMPMVVVSEGEMIKVIGEEIEQQKFRALEVRPWMGRGMNKNPQQRMEDFGPMMRR